MGGRAWHTGELDLHSWYSWETWKLWEIVEYNERRFYQDNVTEAQAKILSTPLLMLQIFVGHIIFVHH